MSDNQCQCLTQKGLRCRKKATRIEGQDWRYCNLHQNCLAPVKRIVSSTTSLTPAPLPSPPRRSPRSSSVSQRENLANRLKDSACSGNLIGVTRQLKAGVDVSYNNYEAFICAITNGHDKIVELLLENGADVDAHNNFLINSLIRRNRLDLIEQYHDEYDAQLTANHLQEAIKLNNDVMIDYLILEIDPTDSLLIFMKFSKGEERKRRISSLLKEKSLIDMNNPELLRVALHKKFYKIAKLLIREGANVQDPILMRNAIKDEDSVAITILVDNGSTAHIYEAEKYAATDDPNLYAHLIDLGFSDNKDVTALLIAAVNHNLLPIVTSLLWRNITTQAARNKALELAVKNNNTEISKLLLENGAEAIVNINQLLHIAEKNNNDELFGLLLRYGVDPSILTETPEPSATCVVQ
jgi:ankyrin repeat protein